MLSADHSVGSGFSEQHCTTAKLIFFPWAAPGHSMADRNSSMFVNERTWHCQPDVMQRNSSILHSVLEIQRMTIMVQPLYKETWMACLKHIICTSVKEAGRMTGKENENKATLTQKMRLKRNIMYFKQHRQPLAMLHFLNSKRNTKDRSR